MATPPGFHGLIEKVGSQADREAFYFDQLAALGQAMAVGLLFEVGAVSG
jgi:hypothetical protein